MNRLARKAQCENGTRIDVREKMREASLTCEERERERERERVSDRNKKGMCIAWQKEGRSNEPVTDRCCL